MFNKLDTKLLALNNRHFFVIDTLVFLITPLLALVLRLDGFSRVSLYTTGLVFVTILFLAIKLAVFGIFGFYKRYWRYASIDELAQMAILTIASLILEILIFYAFYYIPQLPIYGLPRSLPLLDSILSFIFVGGFRFSVRAGERLRQKRKGFHRRERVLIVGAGSSGISLVQEMQRNPQIGLYPVAFVDDDPQKLNLRIRGISVIGNHYEIPEVVSLMNVRRVIIAMPTASGKVLREIVNLCQGTGIKTSTLPGIHEILNEGKNRIGIDSIRDVKIEDLLRREPIETDVQSVFKFVEGKTVLITGAGGSIGSELCRQVFRCRPAQMILLGHGENSVFDIQQELQQTLNVIESQDQEQKSKLSLTAFIADLRSLSRLNYVFEQYKPDLVFHAAAHKHVPMMELNAPEAITNNILGTKNLLDLATLHQVKHFVMISTDKAVNPTNVMGATKRTAEMLVLQAAKKSGRPFVVVRFGNVLGSRGSVVPTFKKQIAKGGPITITHPDICRYFMTIPEAVQLVLQASILSHSGEIFMLNMGQPVKIVDLAKDLIRLSGYEVGKDIEIVFSGLRPGEKLYEELLIPGEEYHPTKHKKILVVKNASAIVPEDIELTIETLCRAAAKNDSNLIFFLLEQLVAGYQPNYTKNNFKANALREVNKIMPSSRSNQTLNSLSLVSKYKKTKILNVSRSTEIENDLDRAIERQEFCLYYQPILNLETLQINAFEALLRWHHPSLGLISPMKFMSAAEKTGAIVSIGYWAIDEICRQLCLWQGESNFGNPPTIGLNISNRQILQCDFVKQIQSKLQNNHLTANSLRLEISEKMLEDHSTSVISVISQLRTLGIQLQIDNFGRNHSYYNHLHHSSDLLYEQFDSLKIDRYLVSRLDRDSESLEFVHNITSKARDFGLEVMAAGVETSEQVDQLKGMRCKYGQGYLFSEPIASQEIAKFLEV